MRTRVHPGGKSVPSEIPGAKPPGSQPTYGPLLLVGGGDDVLFTESAGQKIVQRICAAGGHAQRKVYPGLGHIYGSLKDQMGWIAARFAGKPAPNDCSAK